MDKTVISKKLEINVCIKDAIVHEKFSERNFYPTVKASRQYCRCLWYKHPDLLYMTYNKSAISYPK